MTEDLYTLLIYKQLSGTISPEEAQQLHDWRSSSPEHEKEAQLIELAWNATAPKTIEENIDVQKDFQALHNRIQQHAEGGTITRNMNTRRFWLGIAASVVLLITAGYFLFSSPKVEDTLVEWVEITTTTTTKTITLSDKSIVHLNKNSSLRYPNAFKANERIVELKGEAFFEVQRNPEQAFIVNSLRSTTTVLGTSFNVSDYPGTSNATLFVASGKVRFTNKKGNSLILRKQEGASINTNNELVKNENASPNSIGWYTQRLLFKQTPLFKKQLTKLRINWV